MEPVGPNSAAHGELSDVQFGAGFLRSRRRSYWPRISFLTDAAMLTAAVALSAVGAGRSVPALPFRWTFVFGLLALGAFYAKGLYRPALQLSVLDATRAVAAATGVAIAATVSLHAILTDSLTIAEQSVRLWLLAAAFLAAGRAILVISERRWRRADAAGYRTLIVGAGKVGRLLAKRLADNREFGLRPVGFLDKEPLVSDPDATALPVLGASWDLERIVERYDVQHVVFTFSTAPTEVFLGLLKRCQELGVQTSFVPRLYEKATTETSVEYLGGLPLVVPHARDPKGWQFGLKYALDRVAAMLALALLAPLFAVLTVAVWASLGRPIFYRQERIGRDGNRFAMVKFRSMRPPANPEEDQPVQLLEGSAPGGVEGADRRTRVGALMREFSLDELPQLINIVKGDMSFIGPRPERPEFVNVFEQTVHRYGERHRVKSGITGWAQVHGLRGKTSIADRAEWDNYYIENWSLWLDLKILLMTFAVFFRPAGVE
jgi:exopolysaccharide biosynthesis polyprenyl glycosylphosphotransferase